MKESRQNKEEDIHFFLRNEEEREGRYEKEIRCVRKYRKGGRCRDVEESKGRT